MSLVGDVWTESAGHGFNLMFQGWLWGGGVVGEGMGTSIFRVRGIVLPEGVLRGEVHNAGRGPGGTGTVLIHGVRGCGVLARWVREAAEPLHEFHETGRRARKDRTVDHFRLNKRMVCDG